ncbi:MAG: pantetheine-phosphate adenylyltransferase [Candidatus Margulisbacteria bacterium]|nr:pantetheine-phosphate adenylyltransferase [Candidatus Margulisiibacteriota bacterium]MBU1021499.1 pantetheine-phosphate adenylyltransferase [Candidatus Margulisiibacteriota bacterium]MBU1728584.1 pantetheine-phosphate adenylyltransferase [Candidatus Margulisiibacteriota bacterium]MBU1955837.1 pantetheine-phosphate adenylyltransferase [Candidatus Margulisiibacteriota bacterium]
MKVAIYPGSFDPVTNGHLDVIKRAQKFFDKVIVAVIANPEKDSYFSLEDRMSMLKECLKDMPKIEVDAFNGLLVDFAKKMGVSAIIRGLRAVSDFDYEFQMAITNRKMKPDIETVFFMTDYKYSYLSSSFVKQIAHLGGDVKEFVPPVVVRKLKEK